jgi:CheY-like chemotaxis protein
MYAVLAIEDNDADALLLREAFKEAGLPCKLEIVPTPSEASHLINGTRFDLVICTMSSDPRSCHESIRAIWANDDMSLVPIIVLSGSHDVNAAYEAGANALVSKTADLDRFFRDIKSLLHFWLDAAKLPQKPRRAASN